MSSYFSLHGIEWSCVGLHSCTDVASFCVQSLVHCTGKSCETGQHVCGGVCIPDLDQDCVSDTEVNMCIIYYTKCTCDFNLGYYHDDCSILRTTAQTTQMSYKMTAIVMVLETRVTIALTHPTPNRETVTWME